MEKLWNLYKSDDWVHPFLIVSIYIFIAASFILYLLIIASRNKKIRQAKLKIEYDVLIDTLMSSVIFEDSSFEVVNENQKFKKLFENAYFREVLTESIINLHKNYEGVYAQKIEQFYKDSGLINDSFKKLRSLKWEVKCKAISEFAEFKITEAFTDIISLSNARNKTLKVTAISAAIKLAGAESIKYLTSYTDSIDDWTQLNIIGAFKKHDIGDTKGVEFLLESENTTVVALGLKLIKELKLTQKVPFVEQLANKTPNLVLQNEAQSVLQTLTV